MKAVMKLAISVTDTISPRTRWRYAYDSFTEECFSDTISTTTNMMKMMMMMMVVMMMMMMCNCTLTSRRPRGVRHLALDQPPSLPADALSTSHNNTSPRYDNYYNNSSSNSRAVLLLLLLLKVRCLQRQRQ